MLTNVQKVIFIHTFFLRITIHLLLHKCNFCIFIFGRTFTLRRQPQDGFEFLKLLHYKVFIISHPSLQYLENSLFYFLSLFYVTRFTIVILKGSSFLILQVVPYIFFFNIPFDLDINFLNMHWCRETEKAWWRNSRFAAVLLNFCQTFPYEYSYK